MQLNYSLDEAIRYIKNNYIQGVIINIGCKIQSPQSLKVVGFYYSCYFEHNGNTIIISNTISKTCYFDDGLKLIPQDYDEHQIKDIVPFLKPEERKQKSTAKDICTNYYNFLETLQHHNIKAVIMGHGAVNEMLNWVESTLGYPLPVLKGFNPFEPPSHTNNSRNVSNNSSCLVVIALFITTISLLIAGGLYLA